jgi:indole-3-glycerol phosphate synthase/phosphoribosylanthranilate isomerase
VSVLGKILAAKAGDVAARKAARPYKEVIAGLQRSKRSMEAALRAPHQGFVLECKAASPSRGLIRADLDPAALARDYAPVADAISVITDTPFFQGQLAWLRAVREAVPQPVLCKDFVLEPYQVAEARAAGADALLLMLSVLDDEGYRACAAEAERWGLDALTEVHDASELARAQALGARIVGINNRDLKTLRVDLAVTEALAPQVGGDRVVISESGLFTHADARRLRSCADAYLVGTSLVSADDPGRAARELAYGRVKVCGLTRPADAAAAWDAGATWGGLIFAPGSPRLLSPEQAAEVRGAAPLQWVGVFVNAPQEAVVASAASLNLSAVQLHGDESPAQVSALRAALPASCEVWKAVRVRDAVPTPEGWPGADRLLLDTYHPGARGGTGERFDWSLLTDPTQVVLAGGLGPRNLAEADALGAWALDLNSGVESAPGIKDAQLLEQALAALRG